MQFIFYQSDLYHDRVKRRYELTRRVIEKQGISAEDVQLAAGSRLAQAFEALGFGGFVTYYLALLHGVDPSRIPWVDWFKEQLGK